jgi:hypothetical protein
MMGQRYEATQILNMGRGECVEQLMIIVGDRGGPRVRGQRIGARALSSSPSVTQ